MIACDCGGTRVVCYPPATYPYSDDSPSLQCNACGTYVKDDGFPAGVPGGGQQEQDLGGGAAASRKSEKA